MSQRESGPVVRPNILLLMTDQQRWDAYGSVSDWVQTPHLDRIAGSGLRFTNAYTQAPECIPARVGLALSNYPQDHGVWHNQRYTLPEGSQTWMRVLHDAGYSTSVFGKTHLHPHVGDLRDRRKLVQSYGLDVVQEISGPRASRNCTSDLTDEWKKAGVYDAYLADLTERYNGRPWLVRPTPLPFDLYPDVWVARQAGEHLAAYDGDKPWMCWVSFPGPHEPWDTPEPYASRYRPEDMPSPVTFPRFRLPRRRPTGRLDQRLNKRPRDLSREDIARLRADYAGHVSLIDDQIGELLSVVERRGELDRTVIVLISDHGELNGDFGLLYKSVLLGPAVRVPLLVQVPTGLRGQTAGGVTDCLAELTDIGPTLLDLAGVTSTFGRGKTLVPVLEDPSALHRKVAYSGFRREQMVANTAWRMAVNKAGEPYLLFDLQNDPQERKNLAGRRRYADVERRLSKLLDSRSKVRHPTELHVIHVGKSGGTAIKAALRRDLGLQRTPFGPLVLHSADTTTLGQVPARDSVMFTVRDPISRFTSAFYSRLRKGQPRYYFEWSTAERAAFERFPTPQALATGLASEDAGTREDAERAIQSIRHASRLSRWMRGPELLEKRVDKIVYIGRQETLDADWQHIRRLLELPDDAPLPDDPVSAHRGDPNLDRAFSPEQEAALRRWYAKDYEILEFCDRLRAERGWGVPIADAPPARERSTGATAPALPSGPVSESTMRALVEQAPHRFRLYTVLLRHIQAQRVAEIGPLRGELAVDILTECPDVATYYLVEGGDDLPKRAKGAAAADPVDLHAVIFDQAVSRTSYFEDRAVTLRGRPSDALEQIPDDSLDVVHLGDGADHSLAGVTHDLVTTYPKLRDGGWLTGDDFAPSIWMHGNEREPSMVFPFAVHFAEAMGVPIYALPYRQFFIHKDTSAGFRFVDLAGSYGAADVKSQLPGSYHGRRVPTRFESIAPKVRKRLPPPATPAR